MAARRCPPGRGDDGPPVFVLDGRVASDGIEDPSCSATALGQAAPIVGVMFTLARSLDRASTCSLPKPVSSSLREQRSDPRVPSRQPHVRLIPPSTERTWPVTHVVLGSAIATTQRATSSLLPMRPSGTCLRNASFTAGNSAGGISDFSKPGVSTGPGPIALTRIPYGASSSAHETVSHSTAAFVPPYCAPPGTGLCPAAL